VLWLNQIPQEPDDVTDSPTTITRLDGKENFVILPGGTSSNTTYDTIRAWIDKCCSSHLKCRSDTTLRIDKLKGIRFLRIGNSSIVLTEDVVPDRYACLSHCWGNAKNLIRTNTQNRSEHTQTGVEIDSLPKTYQDALAVCKELDIHYIWIDSLCIVQDDDCDWREQASRMADIYIIAYVSIAAVRAEDASQGLFNFNPESRIGSHFPDYPWAHVRERFYLSVPNPSELNWHKQKNDGKALYKRGWTFQELSLSRRVLHFGAQEVMWVCREATVCEGEPEENFRLPDRVAVNMSESGSSLRVLWYRIVQGYSWRNFTFGKNKFPAIAAFASQLQTTNNGARYVAGLWESTLLFDLLWYCPRDSPDLDTPHPVGSRIIPSWSWASAKRPVHWLEESELDFWQYIPCTEVIQITYNTRGPPILGDIVEASLAFRAPVIKLYKDHCQELRDYWKGKEGISERVTALLGGSFDIRHDLHNTEQARDQSGSPHGNLPLAVLAIPLTARKPVHVDTTGLHALVVTMGGLNALIVTMERPGVYRRAGVGRLGLLEEFLDMYRELPIHTPDQGAISSTQQECKWAQFSEAQKQTREKWKGRFMHEMSRLERQIFKLV